MDKKKAELVITGVLIVIFIIVLTNSIMKIRGKIPPAPKPKLVDEVSEPPALTTRKETLSVKTEQFISKETLKKDIRQKTEPSWGRDPFVREETVISQDSGVSSLKLMGITTGGSKSMAIINNEIVNVGSKVGKFTVLKIVKDRVVLTDGEKNFELMLNK